jgi:hypothetical protein
MRRKLTLDTPARNLRPLNRLEEAVRFLSIYKTAETNTPPSPEYFARMQQLVEDGMKAGWLLATEGCLPSALGARVRSSGGSLTVTDGPFVESKELVAGFALLEANSKEQAVQLTKDFLTVAGEGECELRQIFTAGDSGCGDSAGQHAQLTEQFARR